MADETTPAPMEPTWLDELAREMDPQMRAALVSADPDAALTALPDEALSVMSAAVREVRDETTPRRGGVAPVLGAGVVAEFRKLERRENGASEAVPEGSRIDERL